MPPAPPHASDGIFKTTTPSSHVTSLLDSLRDLFRQATQHGFCPVAAAAYAAQQQPHQPSSRLPPQQFKMGTHVGEGPRGGHQCSCVTIANNQHSSQNQPSAIHRDRRKRHHSQHRDIHNPNSTCSQRQQRRELPPSSPSETTPVDQSPSHMNDLRKEMQNLDDASKMTLVRDRMMSRYKRSKTLELENNVRRLFEEQYKRTTRTGAVLQPGAEATSADEILGCRHYARRCKLKAKCCDLYVTCRFCHDEAMSEDHEMDRFATEKVLCMVCLTEQDVTRACGKCETEFAHYFCKECRFYENTPGKKVYHCDRCHLCRLGEGLDIDNFHCDNCDACVSLETKSYHHCMSKALHSNCPVCRGYLFTSTEPVVFMRCGHTMHSRCFDDYTTGSYQCPLCMRSLTNMEKFFEQIDEVVRSEPMPEEYANKRSIIFCSDCQTKSKVKYHFNYHKCANPDCKGYNTKLIDVFDEEDPPSDGKDTCREQQEQSRNSASAEVSRRADDGAGASSDTGVTVAETLESSEYFSSTGRGSFSSMYVEGNEELGPTDEGQFTQPTIESTV